jgi:hypothetical protein
MNPLSPFNCPVDPMMCQAALCPLADNQQFATIWLENYFSAYGDCAPNREEVHLMIMQKKDLYKQYVGEFNKTQRSDQIIAQNRFNDLWNVLFPRSINRPWCSIV